MTAVIVDEAASDCTEMSAQEAELDERLDIRNHTRDTSNSGVDLVTWQLVKRKVWRRSKQLGEMTRSFVRISPKSALDIPREPSSRGGRSTPDPSLEDLICLEDQVCLEAPDEPIGPEATFGRLAFRLDPASRANIRPTSPKVPSSNASTPRGPVGGGPATGASSWAGSDADEPSDAATRETGTAVLPFDAPAPTPKTHRRSVRRVPWEALHGLSYLGCGEFCAVYAATLDERPAAVKVLKEAHSCNEMAIKDLESETQIMISLDHPGVLRVLAVGDIEGKPFLVLDRLKETLSSTLPKSSEGAYWERRASLKRWPLVRGLQIALELAEALPRGRSRATALRMNQQHAHSPLINSAESTHLRRTIAALLYCHEEAVPGFRLLHRDLKPDNLGFLPDGRLVLFDFGIAKLWRVARPLEPDEPRSAVRKLTGQTGSARYMAPEVAASQSYNTSADVYSFSIILWQLLAHERPYTGMDVRCFTAQVVEGGQRPPLKKGWPLPLCQLMQACWDPHPSTRPGMREVCDRLRELVDAQMSKNGSTSARAEGEVRNP